VQAGQPSAHQIGRVLIARRHKSPIMNIKSRWSRLASQARRFSITAVLSIFCLRVSLTAQQIAPEMPMPARYEDGAEFRWLNKKAVSYTHLTLPTICSV